MKYLVAMSMIFSLNNSFAGALSVERVLTEVVNHPGAAKEALLLLSKTNIKDDYCDVQYYHDRETEIICNIEENSVAVFKNFFSLKSIELEVRHDEQTNVGPGPIL